MSVRFSSAALIRRTAPVALVALAPRIALVALVAALLSVLLVACGGGTDRTKAQVRLVNASPDYSALEMRVDGSLRQGSVAYGSTASYVEIDPGKSSTSIAQSGSATELLSFMPSIAEKKSYSVLAYGKQGALKQLLLDENQPAPADNRTLLRVINAAPDAGNLDLFVTGANDSLASAVAVQAGAAFGTLGEFKTLVSGTWRVRLTAASDSEDVRLDLSGIVLASKQVVTLVVTPGRGGVLVNALLVTQQGTIALGNNTQARLRVVAGVASSGNVGVRVADTTLLTSLASPAATAYRLLPAGTPTAVVSVGGAPLASQVLTLGAGGDYTLLVYGPVGAGEFTLVEDDNKPASSSTQARLRLVNGVVDAAGALSMTLDFSPVADAVTLGAASAYRGVSATTTGQLSVTASGASAPLFGASEQTFAAGAVYSVFMVGSATAPTGIVRKDR